MASASSKDDALSFTTLDQLYDASTTPDGWRTCFDILCAATGSMGAVFRSLDNPTNAIVTPSLQDANLAYEKNWWRHDVVVGTALRARAGLPPVLLDSDLEETIDRANHPFYQDFLRPHGLGSFALYFSPPIIEGRFVLVAQRARLAGPFSAEQSAAMVRLAPHVARALAIGGQLSIARSRDHALLSILEKLTYGAMIIGRNGKVVTMNEAARAMLNDGLMLSDGVLHETSTVGRGTVDRLVKLAFSDDEGASKNAMIHRESGRKPIVLQALSFPQVAENLKAVHGPETILLMMIDTEISGAMSHLSVVQSFGLTLAEAKVAALVGSGISPSDAADQLGSAAGTVRVQLKNVFNKLDIKRQSELVRLMAKLEVLGS